jgi:hypothetical protein
MQDKPDDRPQIPGGLLSDPDPRVTVVVNGERFPRPGLETFFARTPAREVVEEDGCSCHPVVSVYCSCNKVTVCNCVPVCTCQGVCSCVGRPVCTCQGVCSCVGRPTCGCDNHRSSGSTVTGCRCAPVH